MTAVDMNGAIAEQPRRVQDYPLLEAIYERHDALLDRFVVGPTLEVAAGEYAHPAADVALDILPANCRAQQAGVAGDARHLPFADGSFETVIGRRFVHHVPPDQRTDLLAEIHRVLAEDGRFVLLEGTPDRYRRFVKGTGFALGVLGDDTDAYGHCHFEELREHVTDAGFHLAETRPLGSPLLPAAILQVGGARHLLPAIERTQWVRWWTVLVGEVTD